MFLAFNKSIVNELKNRLPDAMTCSTLHSLGYRSLFPYYGKMEVSEWKVANFIDRRWKKNKNPFSAKDEKKAKWTIKSMLDFARLGFVFDEKEISDISDFYSVMFNDKELNEAMFVYEDIQEAGIKKGYQKVDFVDMLFQS